MKELIEKLQVKTNKEEQILQILREIGAELLTKYEIRIKNIIIEPLRVEPYLFMPPIFKDKFTHHVELKNHEIIYGSHQRNRFGKLYIHKGFKGVDIVLSDSNEYAFSFLIKNSRILIDGKVAYPSVKQKDTAKILKEHGISYDCDEIVLYKKELPNNTVVFRTIRNGLKKIVERDDFKKEEQNKYNKLMISSFIELKEHTSAQFDFETGYGGDKAVVEYLKEYRLKNPAISKEELERMRKELYPNGSKTEFEKVFKE